MADPVPQFSERQRQVLLRWQARLEQADGWRADLPVALYERCWLRLRVVSVNDLARELPPDASGEAPELVRYRQVLRQVEDPWTAQLRCWEEFGQQACQQAQRTYWQRQTAGNQGWTLTRYLALMGRYRRQVEQGGARSLPLLLLARASSSEPHQLIWLRPLRQPMRHTCA
jgi:hypothetical protein